MRVYLTGGTGYIGGVLARRLVERRHEVTSLVRATSDRSALESLGVRCVDGDLGEAASLGPGIEGADWIVHAAAELDFTASEERMRRVNVEGSGAVAQRASELGVGRLLNVSSMAVLGGSPADGSAGDESSPRIEPLPTKYARTKLGGERAIDAWATRPDSELAVIHVHPTLVYGPPGKSKGSNAMLRHMARGSLPVVIGADRWLTWIHVDDVVEAIVRMLEGAPPRSRYLLAGDAMRLGDLVRRVAELAGVSSPRLALSPGVAKWALRLLSSFVKGRRLAVARENLDNLKRHWRFSDRAARHDLDWAPRTLEQSLPAIVEWILAT